VGQGCSASIAQAWLLRTARRARSRLPFWRHARAAWAARGVSGARPAVLQTVPHTRLTVESARPAGGSATRTRPPTRRRSPSARGPRRGACGARSRTPRSTCSAAPPRPRPSSATARRGRPRRSVRHARAQRGGTAAILFLAHARRKRGSRCQPARAHARPEPRARTRRSSCPPGNRARTYAVGLCASAHTADQEPCRVRALTRAGRAGAAGGRRSRARQGGRGPDARAGALQRPGGAAARAGRRRARACGRRRTRKNPGQRGRGRLS